jgi:hypothetical protein
MLAAFKQQPKKKNRMKTVESLRDIMGKEAPSRRGVYRWFKKFSKGKTAITVQKPKGRKKNDVYLDKIKNLVVSNRAISIREMERVTGIPRSTIQRILAKSLVMRKMKNKQEPYTLKKIHKEKRIKYSRENLKILENKNNIIVTGDESLFFLSCYNEERWYFKGEKRKISPRKTIGAQKLMVVTFISKNGFEFLDVLEKNKHVNAKYFRENVLIPMLKSLRKKYRGKNIILHYDNATCHIATDNVNFLEEENISTLKQPPYSPDLCPCDFFLFGTLKGKMRGIEIKNRNHLKKVIRKIMLEIPPSVYESVYRNWSKRLRETIKRHGVYVKEK